MLIIDDFQAIMQHENMDRAYETGYPRTHCHFATVDRDELMAFGAKLLARREAA